MKGNEPVMKYQKVLIFIAGWLLFICDLMIKGFVICDIMTLVTYINNIFEISF